MFFPPSHSACLSLFSLSVHETCIIRFVGQQEFLAKESFLARKLLPYE